jgi:peptidoglycan glycosyltransferase
VLDERVAAQIADMMIAACDSGTAYKGFHDRRGRPFLGGAKVAGKTGSLSVTSPAYRSYSWFVGFVPADDPQIVISVLLANPEKWHLKAHTAARMILEKAL